MQRRGDLLVSGKFDDLTAAYRFPMPLFLKSQRILVLDQSEAVQMLARLRDTLADGGATAVRPQISAMDIPRSGRFRVWLDWQANGPRVVQSSFASMTYFFQVEASGLRIEMIACNRLSLPGLAPRLVALARCA